MPAPRPEVMEFLLARRSRPAKTLRPPAPDAAALLPILTAALRVPDHGKLEPWELIQIEGAALSRLGALCLRMGMERGIPVEAATKDARMFLDAPLIVAVASRPVPSDKVPEPEQRMSAAAVCLSLLNAALASGWGANWLTGWTAHDPAFLRDALGLSPPDRIAGYVVIGSETSPPPERPRPALAAKLRRITV